MHVSFEVRVREKCSAVLEAKKVSVSKNGESPKNNCNIKIREQKTVIIQSLYMFKKYNFCFLTIK